MSSADQPLSPQIKNTGSDQDTSRQHATEEPSVASRSRDQVVTVDNDTPEGVADQEITRANTTTSNVARINYSLAEMTMTPESSASVWEGSLAERQQEGAQGVVSDAQQTAPPAVSSMPANAAVAESSPQHDLRQPPPASSVAAHQSEPPPAVPLKDNKQSPATFARASTPSSTPAPTSAPSQDPEWNEKEPYEPATQSTSQTVSDAEFDEKKHAKGEVAEDSKAEIQSIMSQFTGDTTSNTDPTSPREFTVFQYPPRKSSLEHNAQSSAEYGEGPRTEGVVNSPLSPTKDPERASLSYAGSIRSQPPPPEPDPEPDLPFDFHRFLEQLRHRTADPVAKFLRSFLLEFGKKQWQVHEQMKIISDFLTFISNRMAQCEVWRLVSDAEFDNAKEGMEKLVMNRLYTQTFSPEIPPGEASPMKGRRKGTTPLLGPGRKGQHQEDVERDEVLAQKVRIYGWIREEHLDMKPFGDKGKKFLLLAQQELAKIKSYRAPRDKVICVLNCCKVIFGYLRNSQSDQSADTFIPLLIYTVLKAKPDHLVSNVQYILRFRNQDKLGGEAGYYMSSLMGAVQFIETLDRTNLTVSDAEFDKNVEAAVSEIAARNEQEERRQPSHPSSGYPPTIAIEKAAPSRPEVTPRHSMEAERSSNRRSVNSDDVSDNEKAAVAGLLRTIQRPLSTIGRIFSDDTASTAPAVRDRPPLTPQPSAAPLNRLAAVQQSSAPPGAVAQESRTRLAAADAAAMQASAEAAEAHKLMQAEHRTVVETLSGMFPDLDKELISDVVRMKEGRIGLAVDACLALSH